MTDTSSLARLAPVLGVGAVIWNAKRELVLIRRGEAPRKGQWSIPGGRVEWGETLHQALHREVREETGLSIEIVALIEIIDSLTRGDSEAVTHHYVLIDFTTRLVSGELQAGSDADEARWVPFASIDAFGLWSETKRIIAASERALRDIG